MDNLENTCRKDRSVPAFCHLITSYLKIINGAAGVTQAENHVFISLIASIQYSAVNLSRLGFNHH
jgi:hypothetical protein